MTEAAGVQPSRSWAWTAALILLLALRLPSLVQPAGGDQFLYSYVAERVLDGGVPYRDAFEQKPPGIFGVYAVMWGVWPRESVVAAADLLAAALAAWLLVRLGRNMFDGDAGFGAAALFLLLGNPAIQGLGGLNLRAQCETFIALAVTAAIAAGWTSWNRPGRLLFAGVLCGIAIWLKYNAVVYIAPVAFASIISLGAASTTDRMKAMAWLGGGVLAVLATGLAYFYLFGALGDLWAFTIAYNLAYSGETYRGAGHAIAYVLRMPFDRGMVDGLWFLGGVGSLVLCLTMNRAVRPRIVALTWVAAAVLSIAINGSRGLPQDFVQAQPALALGAAAGLAVVWRSRRSGMEWRIASIAVALLIGAGLWRVGSELKPFWQPRLFGLPQAVSSARFDLSYATGAVDRATYLDRFKREGAGKFSPASVERLATYAREVSGNDEPIYVFGFASGGVYVKSGRRSASRFFWSRPVVLEFEGHRPGYGSAGVLADLERERPALVALQKQDWGLAEDVKNSMDFFMTTPPLRRWLEAGYVPDYEDAFFSVWRRRG
jgi:hypothetical protein